MDTETLPGGNVNVGKVPVLRKHERESATLQKVNVEHYITFKVDELQVGVNVISQKRANPVYESPRLVTKHLNILFRILVNVNRQLILKVVRQIIVEFILLLAVLFAVLLQ